MNYKGKIVGLTGARGFIGSALYKRLEESGAYINVIDGDVRDPETFAGVNYEYDYIFHFADPSSQVLFKRQPMYAADTTFKGFVNALNAANRNGARLIYPSTGLLSQDRVNEYARLKQVCEDIHLGTNANAQAIRIFATYGPGESHKRDYASVPYLFARDMVAGRAPEIFGDGEQVRDFIYIDDVVESVLHLAEQCNEPVVDVGSGEAISFNSIVAEINAINDLPEIKPFHIERPAGYVKETLADPTVLRRHYTPSVTFAQGIAQIMMVLKGEIL